MKVTLRAGVILPVAAALSLTACGGQGLNQDYLVASNVKSVACSNVNTTELQQAANVVNAAGPGSRQEKDILKRNPGETSLDPLKTALAGKISECAGTMQSVVDANKNEVFTRDGTRVQLPVVADNGQVVVGDTTREADTPPVAPLPFLQRCAGAVGWDQFVKCVGDDQWYKDGVNNMRPYTGFSWDDVLKWAGDSKAYDVRSIHVYNMTTAELSDEEARNRVRNLVGDDAALKNLPIARHNEFVNSRGLEHERVSPFVDRKKQVRITLSPLVYKDDGTVKGLRGDAGIFVDCLNVWGMPFSIAPRPGTPALCPPDSGMAGQPIPPEGPKGCMPPSKTTPPGTTTPPTTTTTTTPPSTTKTTPVCPPGQHGTPPVCKDDENKLPTHGNGRDPNIDPGPGQYIPPPQMEQPPATSRVNPPPATTQKPAPPPTVKPTQKPGPTPTATPSKEPTNTGVAPTDPGCGNSDLC